MNAWDIVLYLLGALSLVQISPIKINPWSWVGKQIKNMLTGDICTKIDSIAGELDEIKKNYQMEKVSSMRWRVMDFGNSCLQGRKHTKEEWEHCISELAEYESYCNGNSIHNGVMEEMSKFLRKTYRDRLDKKDFL